MILYFWHLGRCNRAKGYEIFHSLTVSHYLCNPFFLQHNRVMTTVECIKKKIKKKRKRKNPLLSSKKVFLLPSHLSIFSMFYQSLQFRNFAVFNNLKGKNIAISWSKYSWEFSQNLHSALHLAVFHALKSNFSNFKCCV